jgi:VanZ family protein
VQDSSVEKKGWTLALIVWIGVILFSSTSLASEWCEEGFRFLSGLFFGHLRLDDSSYGLIHLLADKSVHVSLFLVFALLLWRIFPNAPWKIGAILFSGALVGSASEFLQRFFPGRDPALRDVVINICGTGIGAAICMTWVKYKSRTGAVALK